MTDILHEAQQILEGYDNQGRLTDGERAIANALTPHLRRIEARLSRIEAKLNGTGGQIHDGEGA